MADKYYICTSGETKGPYSKVQLHAMWESGAITMDTRYWTEGLDDWHVIDNLFDEGTEPPKPPPLPEPASPLPELHGRVATVVLGKAERAEKIALSWGDRAGGAIMRFIGRVVLGLLVIGVLIAVIALLPSLRDSASPHDRGYNLGMRAGRDFAKSSESQNTPVSGAVVVYMLSDRVENESEEFKQGYREGFQKGYDDHVMDGFYRR